MNKFSIIIPVYNQEKYLNRCLDSVLKQDYINYEVIIVNDGSTDYSLTIINKYKDKFKNIKILNQDNQGLSEARNNGIKEVKTPYFILLDSDDTIKEDLLSTLDKVINKNKEVEIIRYQLERITKDKVIPYQEEEINLTTGIEAFNKIVKYKYIEMAQLLCYQTKFYKDNKFKFTKGIYHEDFALTPYIFAKTNKLISISYIGYSYYDNASSIMNNNSIERLNKKTKDFILGYNNLIKELNKIDNTYLIKSYISNCLLDKLSNLPNKLYKKYIKEITKKEVIKYILADTLSRKIKKIIISINPRIYYRRKNI